MNKAADIAPQLRPPETVPDEALKPDAPEEAAEKEGVREDIRTLSKTMRIRR
jgi:hypothetical protein